MLETENRKDGISVALQEANPMMNNPTAALNVWLMVGTVILGLALLALAGWLTYRLISGTGRTGGNQTELDGLSRQLAAGDMSVDQYQTAVSTLAGSTASRAPRSTWTITALVAAATALVVGLGALFVGGLAMLEPSPGFAGRALVVTIGGLVGGLGDSLLGATLQERRQCLSCGDGTEQLRHSCGGETVTVGGLPGMDNDAVNAVATAWGGTAAALLWALLAGGQGQ